MVGSLLLARGEGEGEGSSKSLSALDSVDDERFPSSLCFTREDDDGERENGVASLLTAQRGKRTKGRLQGTTKEERKKRERNGALKR